MDVDFTKNGKYYEAYNKALKFHKKYADAKTEDEYIALAKEAGQIFKTDYEIKLGLVVIDEIERSYKNNMKG